MSNSRSTSPAPIPNKTDVSSDHAEYYDETTSPLSPTNSTHSPSISEDKTAELSHSFDNDKIEADYQYLDDDIDATTTTEAPQNEVEVIEAGEAAELVHSHNTVPDSNCGTTIKKLLLLLAAGVPPMTTAVNAFCAFPHIKASELSLDKIRELSPGMLTLCSINAISSYPVNAILNYGTIPEAFSMLRKRMWDEFSKHPFKNSGALTLALGAGISAAALGYASFLPFGTALAWTNFATNGFIFFVTRFYGLINALHRFEKWSSHNFESNPLTGRGFDDLLSHVTDTCAADLEAYLTTYTDINEEAVVAVLKKLHELKNTDPSVIQDKTKRELLGIFFDVALGVGAGLAVLPGFAQKFLDGLDQLKALFTNESKSTTINEFALPIKLLLSSFSIATSILYTGQTTLLRQTGINAFQAITDSRLTTRQKITQGVAAAGLFTANGFACSSIFNVSESANNEPNSISAALIAPDSIEAIALHSSAAAGGFAVNAKLSFAKAFPAPKESTHPTINRIESSADVPNLEHSTPPSSRPSLTSIAEDDHAEHKETAAPLPNDDEGFVVVNEDEYKDTPVTAAPHHKLDRAIRWLNGNTLSKPSLTELHMLHARPLFTSPIHQPDQLSGLTNTNNDLGAQLLTTPPLP